MVKVTMLSKTEIRRMIEERLSRFDLSKSKEFYRKLTILNRRILDLEKVIELWDKKIRTKERNHK